MTDLNRPMCSRHSTGFTDIHVIPFNPARLQTMHTILLYPVAPCVPPETEADPVQRLFCQLNLAFDGLLVMFRL